jgi:uncharacterized protein YejL (UPF0352 family)
VNPALKCLQALSYSSCNDALLGQLMPSLCQMLSTSADPDPVLRLLGNMVTNDCNDSQALQCGLVPAALRVFFCNERDVARFEDNDGTKHCLALRILASLSSSPAFDHVFCSSGMTQVRSSLPCCMSRPSAFTLCFHQVLCEVFSIGERVSCELAARILRNMSIHSE